MNFRGGPSCAVEDQYTAMRQDEPVREMVTFPTRSPIVVVPDMHPRHAFVLSNSIYGNDVCDLPGTRADSAELLGLLQCLAKVRERKVCLHNFFRFQFFELKPFAFDRKLNSG